MSTPYASKPYTAYPTGTDFTNWLAGAGLALNPLVDPNVIVDSVVNEFETRTGWLPFLAGPIQTRLFDPPNSGSNAGRIASYRGGRILDLNAGIIYEPDWGLQIGIVPNTEGQIGIQEVDSAGSNGVTLTRNLQYYLKPNNVEFELPFPGTWTQVEFLTPTRGLPKSIAITARWGRVATLPPDVWYGLLGKAFSMVKSQLVLSTSLAKAVELEEGRIDFGDATKNNIQVQAKDWEAQFDKLVLRWMRMTA